MDTPRRINLQELFLVDTKIMMPYRSLSVLFERLARIVHNDAHSHGLKPTQWEAMRYIARANRFSRTPGALTTYLGMTKGTVSQTLSALEKKGLITKASGSVDKRAVNLALTHDGENLLAQDPLSAFEATFGHDHIAEALTSGLKTLLSERGGRPFGACKTCAYFQKSAPDGNPSYCELLSEPLSESEGDLICVEQVAA